MLRTGGNLVSRGAAIWVGHSVLMVIGFLGFVAILRMGPSASPQVMWAAALLVGYVYLGAIVTSAAAAVLVGTGVVVAARGAALLRWRDPVTGDRHRVTRLAQQRAMAAAGSLYVYAGLGLLTIFLMVAESSGPEAIIAMWSVASVVLLVGSLLFRRFTETLQAETGSLGYLGGHGLAIYSTLNLAALLLVVLSAVAPAILPFPAYSARIFFAYLLLVGGGLVLLVVPLLGIDVFRRLIGHGRRLGNLRPGGRHVLTAPEVRHPHAPAPWTDGRAASSTLGPPAWTPPGAPVEAGHRDPAVSWVLNLRSELDALERAIREQGDSLKQLDHDVLEGRIENGLYWARREFRLERLMDLEQRFSQTWRFLQPRPGDRP